MFLVTYKKTLNIKPLTDIKRTLLFYVHFSAQQMYLHLKNKMLFQFILQEKSSYSLLSLSYSIYLTLKPIYIYNI